MLRKFGHQVEPIEVSGPASRVVARLEALAPDLVFNTAEGSLGRFRKLSIRRCSIAWACRSPARTLMSAR